VVGEASITTELKIKTTLMQQKNFQGVRINEEQDGNADDVCSITLL
jgi:hypothetical protein